MTRRRKITPIDTYLQEIAQAKALRDAAIRAWIDAEDPRGRAPLDKANADYRRAVEEAELRAYAADRRHSPM